ncbi:hypothetical protein CHI07_17040 [Paenibacillus sp. 7884-2]|nr:hypothetical protein CHI07_17040 [Paenibacillus sp. 7884-2]
MTAMKEIDAGLKQTEVKARREYLIRQLNKLGTYHADTGQALRLISLSELEWMHITAKNDFARSYYGGD